MSNGSGLNSVENCSGGVFRSATPNTIPEISWSDAQNFEIRNSAIATRRGFTRKSRIGHKPGCLQFGFSDTYRTHFVRSTKGSYMPQTGMTYFNCFFYGKDLTSTTKQRTFITFTGTTGTALAQVYWGSTDDTLRFRFRENGSAAWKTTVATGVVRSTATDNLYGFSLHKVGATGWYQSIFSSAGVIATDYRSGVAMTFTTWTDMILACDERVDYPRVDYSNASNNALYGYMAEVALTKNVNPTATTFLTNFDVLPPCYTTPTANRIAYYPLNSDFDDQWSLQPSLKPTDIYRAGAGLTHYMLRDRNIPGLSKNPLYCTKSYHYKTDGENVCVFGRVASVSTTWNAWLNGAGARYTLTIDLQPMEVGTGVTMEPVVKSTYGPNVYLQRVGDGTTRVRYMHRFNGTHRPVISYDIPNKLSEKLMFEYKHDATTCAITMKIFKGLGLVATTTKTLSATTTPSTVTDFQLGGGSTSKTPVLTNAEYYMSSMIFQNSNVATSWSEKPNENIRAVTIYTETPTVDRSGWTGGATESFDNPFATNSSPTPSVSVSSSTKIERTGQRTSFDTIMELPRFDTVKGMWLFNEATGYDYATGSQPHGVVKNLMTDGDMDFILYNNTCPIWIPSRDVLTNTTLLPNAFQLNVDRMVGYTPNDTSLRDILLIRNNSLTSYTGTTHTLNDIYKRTHRDKTKMRGFNYGQSLYLHSDNYKLRYNGQEMFAVDCPSPSFPLKLTAVTNGGAGLRGYHLYAYAWRDRNGFLTYPCKPTGSTISYKKFAITCDWSPNANSWIAECVDSAIFYRSKGSTTNLTSLTADASPELYKLREIPISTLINQAGTTWFLDQAADDSLGEQPQLPGNAEMVPNSKYSTLYNDWAYYTGNTYEPTMVYKARAFKPFVMDNAEEFRTEDGERCTGICAFSAGVIVFKRTGMKYYHGGMGANPPRESQNGGCISHDSLINMGDTVIGLGEHGFFATDGNRYSDISTVVQAGRAVSSIQWDLDENHTLAEKSAAKAVYHQPTSRYICRVGNDQYVFDIKRRAWMIYRDIIGDLLVQGGTLYLYFNGRIYRELDQGYFGTGKWTGTVTSAGTGWVVVNNTSALPTTNEEGLPIYVDKTCYRVYNITSLGSNNYKIWIDSNTTFTAGQAYALGVIRHYADTKFWDQRTPGRNKWYAGPLVVGHNKATDGTINLRIARENGTFDDSYDHFQFDTDEEKGQCVLRVRDENMALRFEVMDGNEHEIRSYTFPYRQDSNE